MQNFFWASNVKFLRERAKLTQQVIAEKLELTRNMVAAHENGKVKNVSMEDLAKYSDFFKLAIDSLIRADLSKLGEFKLRELEAGNDVYTSGKKLRVLATTVSPDNKDNVELVAGKAKAGYPTGYGDPDYVACLPVFHMPQLPVDQKFRMFQISGDSMPPIPENAYVIGKYLEDWRTIRDGTNCIIITKEGILFKTVYNHLKEKRRLELRSTNPAYKPFELPAEQVLEIWSYHSYWTDIRPELLGDTEQVLGSLAAIKLQLDSIQKKLK